MSRSRIELVHTVFVCSRPREYKNPSDVLPTAVSLPIGGECRTSRTSVCRLRVPNDSGKVVGLPTDPLPLPFASLGQSGTFDSNQVHKGTPFPFGS